MTRPVLELRRVSKAYGSLPAVSDVSMTVEPGERRALIGPNGAGKTTLFGLIGGSVRPTGGTVVLDGVDVTGRPEHRRARLGVAKTFQRSNLFDGLPARENVAIAVQRQLGIAGRPFVGRARAREIVDRAESLLERVGLAAVGDVRAGALSHGERRQLEVAVALATDPRLLLLDEPVAGMSPAESQAFVDLVAGLPADLTVLLIEHDMDVVFALATRISVLAAGELLEEGPPEQVRESARVQEAYLGKAASQELFNGGILP